MLGILAQDPGAFLRHDPTWESVLPLHTASAATEFGMADLLAYAVPDDGRRLASPPRP